MDILVISGVVFVGLLLLMALFGGKKSRAEHQPITAKRVITQNEQPTFLRLREALPNHIVLAQVAFSALITSKGYTSRSRFNRKVTDFVVLDKGFNVVAIVELDDSSHRGREQEDAKRDAMLQEAGYTVIRYTRTPEVQQVRADFRGLG